MNASSSASRSASSSGPPGGPRATPIRTALCLSGAALLSATGCTRTVLVSESSPVRVGPDVHARVYMLVGGEWELGANAVQIPEGWYLVPPSFVEKGD